MSDAGELADKKKRIRELLENMPAGGTSATLEVLAKEDPVLWCMTFRRLRGHPLTFNNIKQLTPAALEAFQKTNTVARYDGEVKARLLRHRPFLIQPMRDAHPHKVYEKARQIGISELSFSEITHFLWSHPKTKWVLTFPRDTQLKDFSTTRINEAFMETPRMRALLGQPNQTYSKRIGDSFLLLRSAWESGLGEGIDADGVTLDEKDRMKEGVDIAFRESLSSSSYGFLREVSTPTLPGRGVDASYLKSDQHVWLVRCVKCGLEQEVAYPDNIVQVAHVELGMKELPEGTYEYQCRKLKCRGLLDRNRGRWISKFPDRKAIRGYHMPQTIAPWISATKVMQKKIDYKFQQLWLNYVLGTPSASDSKLVDETDFERCSGGYDLVKMRTKDWTHITVGIDWGHLNWVVVTGKNVNGHDYILNVGIFEDSKDRELEAVKMIENFINPYNPDIIVADAGYGKDRNSYLLRKFGPGRFYACGYNPSSKHSKTFVPSWSSPESARLLVDRTMTLKLTCRGFREQEVGLPNLDIEKVKLLTQHFLNLAVLVEEDDGDVVESISCTGDDHLVHSTAYALLALDYCTKQGRFNFDFI